MIELYSIYYFIDTQFEFRFIQFLHCIANISVTKLEKTIKFDQII